MSNEDRFGVLLENTIECLKQQRDEGVEDVYLSEDAMAKLTELAKPRKGQSNEAAMAALREEMGDCCQCGIGNDRTNLVFGVGSADAELVFIGEAPGADEDRLGEPFVGRAGKLLTKMIEKMGLSRSEIYIANILKCRPPDNRDPLPDEIANCEGFLIRQLEIIQPKVIVTLGKYASQTLLRTTTAISELRGQVSEYHGIPLMPTFHPSYLLRNHTKRWDVWEDMKLVLKLLGRDE
jgi:uracil-DNA glycosylase